MPGRPLPVIEEPCSPGAGATVGADDFQMNGGEMGVPGPVLPPFWQDRQGTGVTIPALMDVDRAPEGQMPDKGARVASHIGADRSSG